MFFPLSNFKNKAAEVDRFDNTVVTTSTSAKTGGFRVAPDSFFGSSAQGTVVVSCFPNSQDFRYNGTGDNRFKWMMANFEGANGWWSLCIAGADNIQIGSYTNYPTLLGTSGWRAGQLGVQTRFYNPNVADGVILINSGSTFNFGQATPLTVAFGVNTTTQKYYASVNGETATVVEEARSPGSPPVPDPDWTGYDWFNQLGGSNPQLTFGYSPGDFPEILMSGSYYDFSYYTTPLNQSEMNIVTAQPYGSPTNVLDTQPEVYYRMVQDNKSATREFQNLGTQAGVNNMTTEFQTAGQITSGSVYDAGSNRYRTRVT
jgi:hypothetical protein